MAKSKRYIEKQKGKFAEIINKNQSYKQVYEMAAKKGDLDILSELIGEVDGRNFFVNEMWMNFTKDREKLLDFTATVGIQELSSKLNKEFSSKVQKLYSQKKLDFLDVMQLVNVTNGISPEIKDEQAKYMGQLLDMFTDPNLMVGIHRTGGAVEGEKIQNEGLYLTGHLSSGAVSSIEGEDIRKSLDRNVSFDDRHPGMAVAQVCSGGNYKNYWNKENVDIILVGIPKDEIERNSNTSNYVYDSGIQPVLNPKYILGYATVNSKNNTIASIQSNYKSKEGQEVTNVLEQWKEGVADVPMLPEYSGLKAKFFSFLDRIRGKNKNDLQKDNSKDDDREV